MKTTHDLARQLLAGPDIPVVIALPKEPRALHHRSAAPVISYYLNPTRKSVSFAEVHPLTQSPTFIPAKENA